MLRPSRTRTGGSRPPRAATTALGMLSFIGMAAALGAIAADDGGVSGPGTTAVHRAVDASSTGVGDAVRAGEIGDSVRAGEIGDSVRAGEIGDSVRAAGTGDPLPAPATSPAAPLPADAGTTPAADVPAPADTPAPAGTPPPTCSWPPGCASSRTLPSSA